VSRHETKAYAVIHEAQRDRVPRCSKLNNAMEEFFSISAHRDAGFLASISPAGSPPTNSR
jgi:hypothetical protein